ncbi:hypothetical protein [Bacillus sp. 0909A]|uniref:hypothetical protein n=1 Tax=Bacillus sp. 0909A TaxID=3120561 RepID=UPI002FDAA225
MKLFKLRLDLYDLEDNGIYLRITRNKLFEIKPIYLYYTWDNDGGIRNLDLYIKDLNKEKAKESLVSFMHLLNFMYHMDISIAGGFYIWEVEGLPNNEIVEKVTNKNIVLLSETFQRINQYTGKEYKLIVQCIKYFSRSLKLIELELFEESLLTAYKIIELISNKVFKDIYKEKFSGALADIIPNFLKENFNENYSGQGKDNEINGYVINMGEELITARRKAVKALEHLNLLDLQDEIGEVIRIRNKVGAHSSISNPQVDIETVANTQNIARKMLTKYLFKNRYEKLALDGYKRY